MTIAQKLFSFEGRLRRRDFWTATLILIVLGVAITVSTASLLGLGPRSWGLFCVTLVTAWPKSAVWAKRMHDRGVSAWRLAPLWAAILAANSSAFVAQPRWLHITLSLIAGAFYLQLFGEYGLVDGTPGPNRYGPSPKGLGAAESVGEVFA